MVALAEETSEKPDLGAVLIALRHAIDKLELEFAGMAADFARSGGWESAGFNTAADWLRFNCHMHSNAAWSALKVGEQAANLPVTLEALREGEIGYAHATTMANTADKVKGFDERTLLPLALENSPGKFFHKCVHYRLALDALGYSREQENLVERRALRMSTGQDGCLLVSGIFDPVSGAEIRNAIQPLTRRSGEHDHRSLEQRTADAFHEVITRGRRVQLQVTASAETLLAMPGAPGGEMEFSVPLSPATVQRMACDCSLSRVLLDQSSVVIDVGRATHKIPVGLRKALELRDGHCRWPGCERPASYCDAHHLEHWIEGGPTDLDNLVLLCRRHHRMHHEGGWQLVFIDGELVPVAPTISFGFARGPD